MVLVVIKPLRKFVALNVHSAPSSIRIGILEKWSSGVMGLNKMITDLQTPKINI
jgi:hypothetical protein